MCVGGLFATAPEREQKITDSGPADLETEENAAMNHQSKKLPPTKATDLTAFLFSPKRQPGISASGDAGGKKPRLNDTEKAVPFRKTHRGGGAGYNQAVATRRLPTGHPPWGEARLRELDRSDGGGRQKQRKRQC